MQKLPVLAPVRELVLSRTRANFISDTAKFAVVCGQSGENFKSEWNKICRLQAKSQFPKRRLIFYAVLILFFGSCASGYKAINPKIITYNSKSINSNSDIVFEYKYDLLSKKYKKKEHRKNIKLVAVKITNLSDQDIILGKELNLSYENGKDVILLDRTEYFRELKQFTPVYLLYLLLTPMEFYVETSNGNGVVNRDAVPIGYVIGPGITAANMLKAGSANRRFKTELKEYDLKGKTIKKGETNYGIIGIRADNYDAIKIK